MLPEILTKLVRAANGYLCLDTALPLVVTRAGSAPCRPRLEGSRQSERAKGWLMSGTTRFIKPRNVAGGAVARSPNQEKRRENKPVPPKTVP